METTAQRAAPAALPETRPTLRVVFSGTSGIALRPSFFLARGRTPIGRALVSPGLQVPGILLGEDRQVSRLHASVYLDESGPRIVDEESRNGVYVNGRPIERGGSGSPLLNGDVLRIGDSFLILRDEPLAAGDANIPDLVGRSPAARELRSLLKRVAPTAAMVLLLGESGTGKEVAARALHALSGRSGPFVAVNCSAIPDSLAESQLFGHTRGAFTGASAHSGFFRAAEGGTLFLDEVGELTPTVQPKLLRALEERSVVSVGATTPVPSDVRIIAATNRSIDREVEQRQFRGDLLARLAEFRLTLPPLRERREDILMLFEKGLGERGAQKPLLHPDLIERLLLYGWPYNVRELFKVASELHIRAAGQPVWTLDLVADRLPLPVPVPVSAAVASRDEAIPNPAPASTASPPLPAARSSRLERAPVPSTAALRAHLIKHQGIVADVAKEVRRSRAQVYRWLTQRGLDADSFRS